MSHLTDAAVPAPARPRPGFLMLRAPNAEPAAHPWCSTRTSSVAAPPVPPPPTPPPATDSAARAATATRLAVAHPAARRFVQSTLQPMFEVLDRRRPGRHLSAVATATVIDVLRVLSELDDARVPTRWNRVHVAPPREISRRTANPIPIASSDSPVRSPHRKPPPVGAEVFLTYRRGDRVYAAAGRVECADRGWRWVAFTTAS